MSWWRDSRSVPPPFSVEPGENDVVAASLADAVRAHAPLLIVTASFDGFFELSIGGGDWRMGATAPWRVCRGGEVVFGSGTAGAAWLVDSLVGHAVVAVRSRSSLTDVDPVFELTGGLTLEVFSTVHLDPWVLVLDGSSTWVGNGQWAMFGPGRRTGLPDPDAPEDGVVEAVRADGGLLRLTTGTRSWLFGRSWRVLVDRVVHVSDEDLEPEERLRSTLGLVVTGYRRPSPLTEDGWLRLGADVAVEAFDDGRSAAVAAHLRYCRVCGLRHESPPWGLDGASPTFGFCSCCGVQFGHEDLTPDAVEGYRQFWAGSGFGWHRAGLRPLRWSAEEQLRAIPAPFVARSDGTVLADGRLAAVEGGVLLAAIQAFCRRADGVTVRLPSGWFGRPYDNLHAMTNGYVEDGRAVVEFDHRFTLAVGGATVLAVRGGVVHLEGFTLAALVSRIRAGEAPRDERFGGGCIELHGRGATATT